MQNVSIGHDLQFFWSWTKKETRKGLSCCNTTWVLWDLKRTICEKRNLLKMGDNKTTQTMVWRHGPAANCFSFQIFLPKTKFFNDQPQNEKFRRPWKSRTLELTEAAYWLLMLQPCCHPLKCLKGFQSLPVAHWYLQHNTPSLGCNSGALTCSIVSNLVNTMNTMSNLVKI